MDITFLLASQGATAGQPAAPTGQPMPAAPTGQPMPAANGLSFAHQLSLLAAPAQGSAPTLPAELATTLPEEHAHLAAEHSAAEREAAEAAALLAQFVVHTAPPEQAGQPALKPLAAATSSSASAALATISQRLTLMAQAGTLAKQEANHPVVHRAPAHSLLTPAINAEAEVNVGLPLAGATARQAEQAAQQQEAELSQHSLTLQPQASAEKNFSAAVHAAATNELAASASLQREGDASLMASHLLHSPTQTAAPTLQPASASLAAPVATHAWQQQLGQHMVGLAMRGEQHLELRLNPAELGPLQISLKLAEQGAQAQFVSANSAVRQAIEQALPQLREALAEQGISLGDTSVSEQQHESGAFAQEQPQQQAGTLASNSTKDASQAATPEIMPQPIVMDGRIDLYA